MPGYVIAHIDVTNPDGFAGYREKVPALVEQFGGRYLVRGGAVTVKEGDWSVPRLVILEFDSVAQAEHFYNSPEYQEILPLRLENTRSSLVFAEGVET